MNITDYVVLIICPAFCVIMFVYFKWYIKQRTSASGVINETHAKVKKWNNDLNVLMAEMDAATDRNISLVEDTMAKLKELSNEVDKRINVYVKELEKSRTNEALYTQLGRGVRAALHTESAQDEIKLSKERPDLQVYSAPLLTSAIIARPSQMEQQTFEPEDASIKTRQKKTVQKESDNGVKQLSKQQLRAHIDELASEGLAPDEIAKNLDISVAEVDLAMRLRR